MENERKQERKKRKRKKERQQERNVITFSGENQTLQLQEPAFRSQL